ncbi:MAG: DUF2796 domain-containing protein [Gammaproteobacteria bacterium]|nr:MAG: DUF2796 domain-containing protein [Gammaproteobacteria bacterium]
MKPSKPLASTTVAVAMTLLNISPNLWGWEQQQQHHHGPHLHGEATLQVAMVENNLLLEFRSPAINLVGFEHRPHEPGQWQALRHAEQLLAQPQQRFILSGSDCRLIEKRLELPYAVEDTLPEQPPHDHGEHAEFSASYQYQCTHPEKLDSIDTDLFSVFPGIRRIRASWVFPGGPGSAEWTAEHSRLEVD